MGRRRFIAFRARDRRSYDQKLRANEPRHEGSLWVQTLVQSNLRGRRQSHGMVGQPLSLRHRPGAGHFDDRKLPDGLALEHHASMPADRDWIAQGGFCWGLAALICSRRERNLQQSADGEAWAPPVPSLPTPQGAAISLNGTNVPKHRDRI